MKIVCIYHRIDLDGWMSAAIVKYWHEQLPYNIDLGNNTYGKDTLDFIGWTYGDPIPDLSSYDEVIMCDLSFSKETMEKLAKTKYFTWIDHHISAIKDNAYIIDLAQCKEYNINYSLNPNFAACELTWTFFFTTKVPEIVRLLGRYDCFGHKGTNEEQSVLEFQYGARSCISNYNEAYYYLTNKFSFENTSNINDIFNAGASIYKYLCTEARQTYKNGFEIEFTIPAPDSKGDFIGKVKRFKFLGINRERFNPVNFGINYHKDGYDGVACFWYSNGAWNFSLYNDNGKVDCSEIAKQYGGGGHKGASGFIVTDLKSIINGN